MTRSLSSDRTGSVPASPPRRTVPQRWWALVVCVGAIASVSAGTWLYAAHAPKVSIAAVELGGRGQAWPLPSGTSSSLAWDYGFIAGYGLALWLGTTAARWVFWTQRAATLARLSRGAVIVVVVADLIENLCLTVAVNGTGASPSAVQATALDAAATASTIKFTILVPTAAMALLGIAVTLGRLLFSTGSHDFWPVDKVILPTATEDRPKPPTLGAPAGSRPARPNNRLHGLRVALHDSLYREMQPSPPYRPLRTTLKPTSDEPRWRHAYAVPSIKSTELKDRKPSDDIVGFCLSGGGIRSGSVAMGALQTLRTELRRARYLVSISGGGYTSGALAQLLTDAGDTNVAAYGRVVHDPDQGYGPGSVELDRVRRHSSYIATSATQMLVALAVLARGLLATLMLLFFPAVAIGVAAAWFYNAVPLAVLPLLPPQIPRVNQVKVPATARADAALSLPMHAVLAVAVIALIALLTWLLQLLFGSALTSSGQRAYRWFSRTSVFWTQIGVIVAVGAVGIPTLLWASGRILSLTNTSARLGVSGSVVTVLLTYLASLASIGWRKRKTIQKVAGAAGGKGAGPTGVAAVPNGVLQLLLVIVSVGVLCVSWLLLLGIAAVGTVTNLAASSLAPSVWLAIGTVAVVVILGTLFDESSLSLHPFYRRRLASAFANRAVNVPGPLGPTLVAETYHPDERTTLSRYARPAKAAQPFPEFIFAAAANLTSEEATPPGLNAVSFTMSADWVGGPDVGWVDTATLEGACSARLRRDVTVQAAVAISGAAFASAMGRFARWYQIILAVSGARLGAWLPNPAFLAAMRAAQDEHGGVADWTLPGLPKIRRGTYLLRELFNIHPEQERLLQVTDGGHYENLGIVELLRRRCTTIYCIDGGGDSPPTASGLAEAIALAETELGVRIDLKNPFAAEPGAGRPLIPDATLAALNSTLSKEPVIIGTIHYPAASGLPEDCRTGVLYAARALLWPKMSYSLLSYAAQHPVFPHDSTGDQWFDDGQFTAYTQLGRELGRVVKRVRERPASHNGHVDRRPTQSRHAMDGADLTTAPERT
jgi:hypothetical protein